MNAHMSISQHMFEMNIKDICPCVDVYMQMGVYITLHGYLHVCTPIYTYAYMRESVCMLIYVICVWYMKMKMMIFKCYSSEKLITLNILHEAVPTWYSFYS